MCIEVLAESGEPMSWVEIVEVKQVIPRIKPWVNHCLFKILKEKNVVVVASDVKGNNLNNMKWKLVNPNQDKLQDDDIPKQYLAREELYKVMPGI